MAHPGTFTGHHLHHLSKLGASFAPLGQVSPAHHAALLRHGEEGTVVAADVVDVHQVLRQAEASQVLQKKCSQMIQFVAQTDTYSKQIHV